jgi:hypothetical protein
MSGSYTLDDWIEDVCEEHGFAQPIELGYDAVMWVEDVCEEHGFTLPKELISAYTDSVT